MSDEKKTKKNIICRTRFRENIVENKEALSIFELLKQSIEWKDGIKTRNNGFTRKAVSISLDEYPLITDLVIKVLKEITDINYLLLGIYINYYENGNMYTPNHSHKGSHQLVISLGGERTLIIGKKNYRMKNGDAVIFGSSIHGVPKEQNANERISIATFMIPL